MNPSGLLDQGTDSIWGIAKEITRKFGCLRFSKKSRLTTKLVAKDFLKRIDGQDRNNRLEKVCSQNCRPKCLVANLAWNSRQKAYIVTDGQRNTAL
jgi:hypothetical protein